MEARPRLEAQEPFLHVLVPIGEGGYRQPVVRGQFAGRDNGDAQALKHRLAGGLPALDVDGLGLAFEDLADLFHVDTQTWLAECDLTDEYFGMFGTRVPDQVRDEFHVVLRQFLGVVLPCACRVAAPARLGCGRLRGPSCCHPPHDTQTSAI